MIGKNLHDRIVETQQSWRGWGSPVDLTVGFGPRYRQHDRPHRRAPPPDAAGLTNPAKGNASHRSRPGPKIAHWRTGAGAWCRTRRNRPHKEKPKENDV